MAPAVAADPALKTGPTDIVALPLGGRVKFDPWNDELAMLKAAPVRNLGPGEACLQSHSVFTVPNPRNGYRRESRAGQMKREPPAIARGRGVLEGLNRPRKSSASSEDLKLE